MGLTTALFNSLSGMIANSQAINVAGNNIANSNTTGFKASRAAFETQISQTISNGSAPKAELGGTNPVQVGFGTRIASVTRNFESGSLQPTGINTDLAIEGSGLFALTLNGQTRYTRDGSFTLDTNFDLVNADGGLVQGFGVDSDFQVIGGVVQPINIPVGLLTLAQATESVQFSGNLDAGGDSATVGTVITSDPIYSDGAATVPATAADALTSLFDGGGSPLFALNDVIAFSGARKGGSTLPNHIFEVGPTNTTGSDTNGTTLQDLMDFFKDVLGIDTSVSGGLSVTVAGELRIEGNTGTSNDIEFEDGDVIINQATSPTLPFALTKQVTADGESVRTTFVAFDSLGNPLTIDMSVVLEDKTVQGTKWRVYVQSEEDTDLDRVLGAGIAEFDTSGQLITTTDLDFMIDRANTGAFSPQQISVVFSDPDGAVSALAATSSEVLAFSQDGLPIGTLEGFGVGEDGTIAGVFSNGLLRDLGRITLAQFANPQGLEDVGGNLFRVTVSSGIRSRRAMV